MITIVTLNDFTAIKESFTEEETQEKYGRLIVMSEEEYKENQTKLKRMR